MAVQQLHDAELVDAPVQMPAGEYAAYYLHHRTGYYKKSPRVSVSFRIHGGEYHGAKVMLWCRVDALRGKPAKNGGIKLRHTSKLYRQFVRMSGCADRPDRVSLQRLRGCLIKLRVRTVTADDTQRDLPSPLQYPVVDELLSIEAGQV